MPTKSRRISRPVHRTNTGRVVYDRKKHIFTEKDVARILRNAQLVGTDLEFLIALLSELEIFIIRLVRRIVNLGGLVSAVRLVVEWFKRVAKGISAILGDVLRGGDEEPAE